MRCSLRQWATAVGGGAVRAERRRAAGDLHDPLHAGGDGGVQRRGLVQVLVGPVGGEQQQPLDAVEGRRQRRRRAQVGLHRGQSELPVGAADERPRLDAPLGEARGDVAADAARRSEHADHAATSTRAGAATRRHARAPARTSSGRPQANTKRSGRSSAHVRPRRAARRRRRPDR